MQIEHEQTGKQGRFFLQDNGNEVGEIEYVLHGENSMEITHTEVDEAYSGKNLGATLVERAVELARENNWRVIATCHFAKALIARRPDLQDVVQ